MEKITVQKPKLFSLTKEIPKEDFIVKVVTGEIADDWNVEIKTGNGYETKLITVLEFLEISPEIRERVDELRKANIQRMDAENAKRRIEADAENRQKQAEEELREKAKKQKTPDPHTLLSLRVGEVLEPGYFRPNQIRARLRAGSLPYSAEYRHPSYPEWMPCGNLESGKSDLDELTERIGQLEGVLASQSRSIEEQSRKIKWAVRSAAIALWIIIIFGITITQK